jgi:hypothetical protein
MVKQIQNAQLDNVSRGMQSLGIIKNKTVQRGLVNAEECSGYS